MDQEQDEIVIYWRPDCVFCLDLLRLKFRQLRYRKVDIRKDPGAKRQLIEGFPLRTHGPGRRSCPVVHPHMPLRGAGAAGCGLR